uniref:Uncharacterized protein n=1 Tax=Rhizophora mucronata TaxID=61149 RepID=A0A2P2JRW7_RHIMU
MINRGPYAPMYNYFYLSTFYLTIILRKNERKYY